ncbi:MAG: histidine kinase dimerization/phospho-acceptor domain-containing protein [Planctomycetota bacterium]
MPVVLLRPAAAPSAAALLSALRAGLGPVHEFCDPDQAQLALRGDPRTVLVLDLREADSSFRHAAARLSAAVAGAPCLTLLRPGERPPWPGSPALTAPFYLREVVAFCRHAALRPPGRALLEDLAAGLSHEIGNPLQALQLQLQMLREEPASPALRQSLEELEAAGRRIQAVVADVAGASERAPITPAPLRLAGLLERARGSLAERGHDLSSRLELHCEDAPLVADGPLMAGALADLWEYLLRAGHGGERLAVDARIQDECLLSIRARARVPRLPADAAARLFTPLWARQALGLPAGLSLTAARSAFLRHGGELRAEARPAGELLVDGLLPRAGLSA